MHILALAILALVLGFIHQTITPKIQAVVPPNVQQGRILGATWTGAFILVSFFLANVLLGLVGFRRRA